MAEILKRFRDPHTHHCQVNVQTHRRKSILAFGGRGRANYGASGVTLVEVVIAFPIVLIAVSMLFGTIVASARQRVMNQQKSRIAEYARALIEEIRNEDLADVFALYNADPFDDPNGPGTAPGNRFNIDGIAPPRGSNEKSVGEILLPGLDVGVEGVPDWQLREDAVMPNLEMPRDLNRDNIIDQRDHSTDVAVLPVRIVVSWQGALGPQEFSLQTIITEYLK